MYGMSDSIELDTGLDTDLTDATFVVVDTETTGVSADRDRLIEIAAVKVRGGEIIERFTQLIDPERAVPQRITRITGITTAMVFGKPRAADVLPTFCEFLGDGIFVAHNLSFDWRFVTQACRRARVDIPECQSLCTLKLARRLLRGLRSKGLASVADFYGIPIHGRHRALGDAEATAQVLIRFLHVMRHEHNIHTLGDLLAFQNRSYQQIRAAATGLDKIRRDVLPQLPDAPGVYFMKDARGAIIYIGKALSLKSRVRSYFSSVEALPPRLHKMVSEVREVGWKTTPSELGALLLESRLIKQHTPRYNRAQLEYRNRPFLKLDKMHPFPRLTPSAVALDDGAEYFGPLGGRRERDFLLHIVDEFFGLRECDHNAFARGRPCVLAPMGRCPFTPCAETSAGSAEGDGAWESAQEAYAAEVQRVRDFLHGRDTSVVTVIEQRMREAASRLEFEQASYYRDALKRLEELQHRQHALAGPVFERNGVAVWKGKADRRVMVVVSRGRLTDELEANGEGSWESLRNAVNQARRRPAEERYWKEEADELRLVQQWNHRNRDHLLTFDLDDAAEPDAIADRIRKSLDGGAEAARPSH